MTRRCKKCRVFRDTEILRERVPFDVVFDVCLCAQHVLAHPIVHRSHRFTFAHDLCRYALPKFALRAAILIQRLRGPGKHINKPGRHRETVRVDNRSRFRRLEIANSCDAIAANRNIGLPWLGARAVVNRSAPNDNVKISGRWRWRWRLRRDPKHNCQERADAKEILFHSAILVWAHSFSKGCEGRTALQSTSCGVVSTVLGRALSCCNSCVEKVRATALAAKNLAVRLLAKAARISLLTVHRHPPVARFTPATDGTARCES